MKLLNIPAGFLSTVDHLESEASLARLSELCLKWPRWRFDKTDHTWMDLSACRFIGLGQHEIMAFTFRRHVRRASLTGASTYPIWLAAGPHWSDRWHDAQGNPSESFEAGAIVRGGLAPTAFMEPLSVLAIASCPNGQFGFDEALRRVSPANVSDDEMDRYANPRFRKLTVAWPVLLEALEAAVSLPAPAIAPISPGSNEAVVSISVEQAMHRHESRQSFPEVNCPSFGAGSEVVYAYTYAAALEVAQLSGDGFFPVKIGFAQVRPDEHRSAGHAALLRVGSQIPFREPVRILALLNCAKGNATEKEIHRSLKSRRIHCPGREWFAMNEAEVVTIFSEFSGRQ